MAGFACWRRRVAAQGGMRRTAATIICAMVVRGLVSSSWGTWNEVTHWRGSSAARHLGTDNSM